MSAFLGVGGGIVLVPLLNLFYPDIPQKFIIATSLSIILFNSLFNSLNFRKRFKLDVKIILPVAFSSIIFAWFASYFVSILSSSVLKLIFAISLILIAIKVVFSKPLDSGEQEAFIKYRNLKSLSLGAISGSIAALSGLGGGAINIPLLHLWLKISFDKLSAYSNAIMFFTVLSSTIFNLMQEAEEIAFVSYGLILPKITLIVIVSSFLGSHLAVQLHEKVSDKKLKQYFVLLLILIIIRSLFNL